MELRQSSNHPAAVSTASQSLDDGILLQRVEIEHRNHTSERDSASIERRLREKAAYPTYPLMRAVVLTEHVPPIQLFAPTGLPPGAGTPGDSKDKDLLRPI